MIPSSLDHLLARQRTLLLQGPMGDFFTRLHEVLVSSGQAVWKVNFNGGDEHFFPPGPGVYRYDLPMAHFGGWLNALIDDLQPDTLVLFGQSRRLHAQAIELARARGLAVFVFEEGYLRPDYVTLEEGGVNAASELPRQAEHYRRLLPQTLPAPQPSGQTFGLVAWVAFKYGLACRMGRSSFPHYQHHREIDTLAEFLRWWYGDWRKWRYRWIERGLQDFLSAPAQHKRFFLVPLQVCNDSQIHVHSRFEGVGEFIDEVLDSFAAHAPKDRLLVFKHHPLDRPYSDYAEAIRTGAAARGLQDRVLYLHDQHLPTLLQHACGVVTINSTTGLQSLFHRTPVITLGESVYDVDGLVFGGTLDEFWHRPGQVDVELFKRFRHELILRTQLNASFYGQAPGLVGPAQRASSRMAAKRREAFEASMSNTRPHSPA